jgi:hypothetical protein
MKEPARRRTLFPLSFEFMTRPSAARALKRSGGGQGQTHRWALWFVGSLFTEENSFLTSCSFP